ncbi:MbnP family protein [Flavobacterium sangjuense]|uniref:MbnP family protein n=1 Tax=Flavobacterium sangjuense TaxID=2518177 RepID=UPI00109DDBE2|nr:MbnP family protein [Flavobacterium sangjuense]
MAVSFHLEFNKLPLELNKKYVSVSKDTLIIETFRCYISNIQIQYEDKSVFTEKNSYHLLDAEHPDSFQIPITKKSDKLISKITFDIGIDSLTNTSGAMAGDLDPIKGMYWAWQSGYINTKIEGKSSSCKTRNNEFQFHIGGYLQPYYAIRKMKFDCNKKADNDIYIGIDLNPFFSNLELKETNSVMIPGKDAMKLANYSTKMFYSQ